MTEATFDRHGYPSEATLNIIRSWSDGLGGLKRLMEFCAEAWSPDYGEVRTSGREWTFITGGWSGNEEVIQALVENVMAYTMCWQKSERGGLHVFEVPQAK